MQKADKIKWDDAILMLLGCSIAAYVILKIICLGITDDEAWSYYNVKQFWYVETLCTGNTHWFNFLAMKAAIMLGFEKAWQLRWFTALSGLTFIFLVIKWLTTINHGLLKLFTFSLLLLNPYVLDYLSLARGYVTGLAFMGFSLMFFYKSINDEKDSYAPHLSLLFAGLSAIANFNFFYYFTAFYAVYVLWKYLSKGFQTLKEKWFYIELTYVVGISALVLRALKFITDCSNDIGGCGGESFVDSIFGSYVLKGFFPDEYEDLWWLKILAYAFFGLIAIATIFGMFKYKQHGNRFYQLVCYVLLVMLFFTIINKLLFNVLFPIHRTTLMFYPLYAIVIVNFLTTISFEKVVIKFIAFIIVGLLTLNFFKHLNLKETTDYYKQADAEKAFEILNTLQAKKVGISPELYVLFIKYYSQIYPNIKGDMLNTVYPIPYWLKEHSNQLQEFDYLLLYTPYNLQYYSKNAIRLEAVTMLPEKHTLLVKVLK